MCLIKVSSEGAVFLIILFQFYGTKAAHFEGNYSDWASMTTPNLHIGERTNPILIQFLMQLLYPIDADVMSFLYLVMVTKVKKKLTEIVKLNK